MTLCWFRLLCKGTHNFIFMSGPEGKEVLPEFSILSEISTHLESSIVKEFEFFTKGDQGIAKQILQESFSVFEKLPAKQGKDTAYSESEWEKYSKQVVLERLYNLRGTNASYRIMKAIDEWLTREFLLHRTNFWRAFQKKERSSR